MQPPVFTYFFWSSSSNIQPHPPLTTAPGCASQIDPAEALQERRLRQGPSLVEAVAGEGPEGDAHGAQQNVEPQEPLGGGRRAGEVGE